MTEFDKYCGCSKPVLNGCPSQTDLGCTYYTGDKLDPLNIDKGTNGNSIIKIINDYIKNVPDFFWNDEEFLLKLFKNRYFYFYFKLCS